MPFILIENTKTSISKEDKKLVGVGNLPAIKSSLQKISDNKDNKEASKASFKLAQLAEGEVNYREAIKYYKKAVDFPDYNKLYRLKAIDFAKKLKLKEEEKYFENKLYYGSLDLPKGGLYTGVIKNGLPSYCGIVRYRNGSHYIGQFNKGHRIGYGFTHIKNNTQPYYLRRYNHNGKIISRGEKVQSEIKANGDTHIGEMKKSRLHGRGLVLYKDGNILLANFRDGHPKNGVGCYFDRKEKILIWREYNKLGKQIGSSIIKEKR